jgi:hypothetical protein
MPKYLAIHVFILAGLVVAVTFLVFQSRALTIKLDALEARQAANHAPKPVPGIDDAPSRRLASESPGIPTAPEQPAPKTTEAPHVPRPPETASLTPSQEQAVEHAVNRILKEKYGHLRFPRD